MANKLAGQRAKFSRARAIFYSDSDETRRNRAVELMAEVLVEAPTDGFSIDDVTQSEDVPDDVRQLVERTRTPSWSSDDDPDEQVSALQTTVDMTDCLEFGDGAEFVYVYGYRCAPDRVKIGSCIGDVLARVAAQIGTGTPDKPRLLLQIRTHDCRALERTLHGYFRLRRRKIEGAGAEWFLATRDDVVTAYEKIRG